MKIKLDVSGIEEKNPVVGNRDIFWLYHRTVENLISQNSIETMLEIGPWDGGVFRGILKNVDKSKWPKLIAMVDSWIGKFFGIIHIDYSHIDKIAEEGGYDGKLDKYQGNSHEILPSLNKKGKKYDLVLVDGDHSKIGQEFDVWDGWKLVAKGGLLLIDDAHLPGYGYIHDIIMNFWKQHRDELTLLKDVDYPPHPGCMIFIKK